MSRISAIVLSATVVTGAVAVATNASALGSTRYVPVGGNISKTWKVPSPTKKLPAGIVLIPGNGGISFKPKFPLPGGIVIPAKGGIPGKPQVPPPAMNPATPSNPTTKGAPGNMRPIVLTAPGPGFSGAGAFGRDPRQVLLVSAPGQMPAPLVDAPSSMRPACGWFTADGGYMTWRKFVNANGEAQLVCVKMTD